MKALIKATGEIVNLDETRVSMLDYARSIYVDENGKKYKECELEFIQSPWEDGINWEQRRYEIAKDVFVATFVDPNQHSLTIEADAQMAVKAADALIAELKRNAM